MKLASLAVILAATLAPLASASATTIVHEDGAPSHTDRYSDDAPVGRLTVSSDVTIDGFGVDVDLYEDGDLTFLIFDSTNGALLYASAPKAFVDNGAGYKFSNPFNFTFHVGTTYGLTATSSVGGTYFGDEVANDVGAFSFLTGNQNVYGTTLDLDENCCDVFTAIVVDDGAVPEPASWALMILGFGAVGASLRRRTALA